MAYDLIAWTVEAGGSQVENQPMLFSKIMPKKQYLNGDRTQGFAHAKQVFYCYVFPLERFAAK